MTQVIALETKKRNVRERVVKKSYFLSDFDVLLEIGIFCGIKYKIVACKYRVEIDYVALVWHQGKNLEEI